MLIDFALRRISRPKQTKIKDEFLLWQLHRVREDQSKFRSIGANKDIRTQGREFLRE
jgi:hypothetical protein